MATTFTLKRKYFAEADQNKGMSTAGKVAAVAGTTALAFAGARRGMLGNNMMKQSNALWAKAGNAIGAQGMVKSGAKGVGIATAKAAGADLSTVAGKKSAITAATDFKNTLAK